MKHAYLIMAHRQIELLKILLEMLDDYNNDIYLHIDKKWKDFDEEACLSSVKKSKIHFVERKKLTWGGFSLVNIEFDLLREASKENYSYYHLLSGADLPIKSQKYIHSFFENNSDKEFISFDYNQDVSGFKDRVSQYIIFQELYGNNKNFLYKIDAISIRIQRLLGINRMDRNPFELKKGAQWFSITHKLVEYLISEEEKVKKSFRYTRCSDELFLQSVVYNSVFNKKLYYNENARKEYNMRYIDFKRGNPYVFRYEDLELLKNREELFARKFDWDKDKEIILAIKNWILGGKDA